MRIAFSTTALVLACSSSGSPSLAEAGASGVSGGGASTMSAAAGSAGVGGVGSSGIAGRAGAATTQGGGPAGGSGSADVGGENSISAGAANGGAAGSRAQAGSAGTGVAVGTPKNPVLPGYNADPQIAQFGGKFYIYPTTDGYDNWLSTQFHAFSSADLVTWKDEGVILDLGADVSWADDRAWAPGITLKGDTYYFYFAAAQQIGVATSKSPAGPFKDALGRPLVKIGQYGDQSIDPYVFTDDDGRSYLYFGSGSTAHVVELNSDMVSFKGSPTTISVGGFREGSVAFKHNGSYYFMWSENDTRSADYNVAYATGKSPLGPFTEAAQNPILQKNTALGILGTGHNSVLALANGDWYIAYHRFAIPNGDGTHREV